MRKQYLIALFDLIRENGAATVPTRTGLAYAEGLAAAAHGLSLMILFPRATLLPESVDTLTRKGYADAHGVAFDVTDELAIEAAFSKQS